MEDPMVLEMFKHHLETNFQYPNVTDLKHIYQTILTPDTNDEQSKFAIPSNQVVTPFLTQTEELYLQWKIADGSNTKIPLNVVVGFTQYKLSLSRLDHSDSDNPEQSNIDNAKNKRKGKEKVIYDDNENGERKEKEKSDRWKYVVNSEWNKLKTDNHFESGDLIQIMSFRSHNHEIGFIISHTPRHLILYPY